jgi:hypothetical protein
MQYIIEFHSPIWYQTRLGFLSHLHLSPTFAAQAVGHPLHAAATARFILRSRGRPPFPTAGLASPPSRSVDQALSLLTPARAQGLQQITSAAFYPRELLHSTPWIHGTPSLSSRHRLPQPACPPSPPAPQRRTHAEPTLSGSLSTRRPLLDSVAAVPSFGEHAVDLESGPDAVVLPFVGLP